MKRDMDLIRMIFLEMEKRDPTNPHPEFNIESYDFDTIQFHLKLLIEQNFIKGNISKYANGKINYFPLELTWAGYDFLDAARNQTVWESAKKKI